MRIGLHVPNFTWPEGPAGLAAKLAEIAGAAEDAGFDSLWVMDHYFQIPQGLHRTRHEEQQADARMRRDVHHRVDPVVAAAVRNQRRLLVRHRHETGASPRGVASSLPSASELAIASSGDSAMERRQCTSRWRISLVMASSDGSV